MVNIVLFCKMKSFSLKLLQNIENTPGVNLKVTKIKHPGSFLLMVTNLNFWEDCVCLC